METARYALSIKQPWAALLVLGLKTIEVRTWSARRRGPILIHAGKVPDPRPEAWAQITTPQLQAMAELRGGIIGMGELCDCILYDNMTRFAADESRHRNAPEWFLPGGLYGFVFQQARPLPFFGCPGNTSFFRVAGYENFTDT